MKQAALFLLLSLVVTIVHAAPQSAEAVAPRTCVIPKLPKSYPLGALTAVPRSTDCLSFEKTRRESMMQRKAQCEALASYHGIEACGYVDLCGSKSADDMENCAAYKGLIATNKRSMKKGPPELCRWINRGEANPRFASDIKKGTTTVVTFLDSDMEKFKRCEEYTRFTNGPAKQEREKALGDFNQLDFEIAAGKSVMTNPTSELPLQMKRAPAAPVRRPAPAASGRTNPLGSSAGKGSGI